MKIKKCEKCDFKVRYKKYEPKIIHTKLGGHIIIRK